jgi:TnpA family transposase
MSATSHEALYVLDGLLHHGTALNIGTHYTDTGGASDHVFILCTMLGIRFCPRLRDLPDRKLACIELAGHYPGLQPLIGRRIKIDVIREHWGEIVRLVASLDAGIVAPSTMLKKLAAYRRQNQLDVALQELGRIERTLFMIDWLSSPALRRRCNAGLNKSEQRHYLAQGDALLAHTTPRTWEHIGFSGDFLWDRAAATASKRRPLNLGHMREAA